jgi:hypothetical protein
MAGCTALWHTAIRDSCRCLLSPGAAPVWPHTHADAQYWLVACASAAVYKRLPACLPTELPLKLALPAVCPSTPLALPHQPRLQPASLLPCPSGHMHTQRMPQPHSTNAQSGCKYDPPTPPPTPAVTLTTHLHQCVQAKAYAHEMVHVSAARVWVARFCLRPLLVLDCFTLLMTLSELLPLSWQMDWWSTAAGELTAAGYCQALKVLASTGLASVRSHQIVLAMQVGGGGCGGGWLDGWGWRPVCVSGRGAGACVVCGDGGHGMVLSQPLLEQPCNSWHCTWRVEGGRWKVDAEAAGC